MSAELKAAAKLLRDAGWIVEPPDVRPPKKLEMIPGYKVRHEKPETLTPDEVYTAFRMAGFTEQAINYPLSEPAYLWLCHFNGVGPDKAPWTWRYAPNPLMQASLDRDGRAAGLAPKEDET